MSDHVVFGKPVILTEEKLKDVIQSKMKQRALKEALDKQVAQVKKRKEEAGIGKKLANGVRNTVKEQTYNMNFEDNQIKIVPQGDPDDFIVKSTGGAQQGPSNGIRNGVTALRPVYQSNSLPPNFSMSTSEGNPLAPQNEYNTKSLPVGLTSRPPKSNGAPNLLGTPNVRERIGLGASPHCSPLVADSPKTFDSNCLPRNFNMDEVKAQLQVQQPKQPSPQRQLKQAPPLHMGMVKPPVSGGRKSFAQSPKRPGGHLPPLEIVEGFPGRRPVESTQSSGRAIESNAQELLGTPLLNGVPGRSGKARNVVGPRGRSNEARGRAGPAPVGPRSTQARMTENQLGRLQKELETREIQMAKMREKERNWEEQVKQLKNELKNAKRKERDLNRLVKEVPRRAETAPDPPVVSPPMPGALVKGTNKGSTILSTLAQDRKQAPPKSKILPPKTFRPISAPLEAGVGSYVPEEITDNTTMQDSFKCASFLTRKTAFGLPEKNANKPVPIEYEHLLQFVEEKIITQRQADALWRLFTNGESPLALLRRQSMGPRAFGDASDLHGPAGRTHKDAEDTEEDNNEEASEGQSEEGKLQERKYSQEEEGEEEEEEEEEGGEEVGVEGEGEGEEEDEDGDEKVEETDEEECDSYDSAGSLEEGASNGGLSAGGTKGRGDGRVKGQFDVKLGNVRKDYDENSSDEHDMFETYAKLNLEECLSEGEVNDE